MPAAARVASRWACKSRRGRMLGARARRRLQRRSALSELARGVLDQARRSARRSIEFQAWEFLERPTRVAIRIDHGREVIRACESQRARALRESVYRDVWKALRSERGGIGMSSGGCARGEQPMRKSDVYFRLRGGPDRPESPCLSSRRALSATCRDRVRARISVRTAVRACAAPRKPELTWVSRH